MTQQKWNDRDLKILHQLNTVVVTKDDLWDIAGKAEILPQNLRNDPEAGAYLTAQHYKGNPEKAQAVYFRMKALAHFLGTKGAHGWTLPKLPSGEIPTQEVVFSAAAIEPLTDVGNQIGFDNDSFLNRILSLAEPKGNA